MKREAFAVGTSLPPMSPLGSALFALGTVHAMAGYVGAVVQVEPSCIDGEHVGPIRRVGWHDRCEHCGEQVTG